MGRNTSFVALLLGGIIESAQFTVMWGLVSSLIGPSSMDAAGWLLLIVPVGALLGVVASALLVRLKASSEGWSSFFSAWGLATLTGFPVALAAPSALVGLGPDNQQYRFTAFVIEYGFAWLVMVLLFRPKHREP